MDLLPPFQIGMDLSPGEGNVAGRPLAAHLRHGIDLIQRIEERTIQFDLDLL